MPVDNSALIRPFVPSDDDGCLFSYTEILDRTKRTGNNGARLLRTFYHRSRADLDRHLPSIRAICDATGARAYTRLSLRTWQDVGKLYTKMVVEAAMAENWNAMKTLYSSACGKVKPCLTYWLFDVDDMNVRGELLCKLCSVGVYVTTISSRSGVHFISRPFDIRLIGPLPTGVALLRDHPTNLYVPDGVVEHNKPVLGSAQSGPSPDQGSCSTDVEFQQPADEAGA